MKRLLLGAAFAAIVGSACKPVIEHTDPGTFIVARFDPSAVPPVLPTPNDLATNPATGLLAVPISATANGADRAFYQWLNTLDGFPAAATATATFTGALNGTTVTATTIKVHDLSAANAAVTTSVAYADGADLAAPGVLSVSPPTGGWLPGHRYAVAVVGGANGVKGKDGTTVIGSATWAFIRNEKSLVTCADLKTDCRPTTEIIPSTIKDDQTARLAAQTATALQLEQLRLKYKPAIDTLVAAGTPRTDIALLWEFKINAAPAVLFDPAKKRLPSPNDLAISNGVVMAPIDTTSSPANQEFTRDYINTLNGFPASAGASASIVGETLNPATVNASTVKIIVVKGEPLAGDPVIGYNATSNQITLTPSGGSWGTKRTIAVAIVGGPNGAKSVSGKSVVGTDAWALVRSPATLVDCVTLGATCKSVVTAAPISNEQAIGLEGLRRGYAPILDLLEQANGVTRQNVAALWVFSTVDQPEFIFDPVAVPPRIPVPTNLALNSAGKVAAPVPAGASPAYAEFITEYLNTLNGFPVASTATAAVSGDINPTTVSSNTVRVVALQGGALTTAPTIVWDSTGKQVVVSPAGGSWGKSKLIAIAVLGGSGGVKDNSGKSVIASQVFAFARLENTLVDCVTLGPTCKSVVAPSDAQAIALEGLRRGFKPIVDAFVAQGITRRDLAGLWFFSTVNQPELTFDLGAATPVIPFPANQFLRAFNPLGAQTRADGGVVGDDIDPTQKLTFPSSLGALAAGLNTLNGFSLTAPMVSENSDILTALDTGNIDQSTLATATGFAKIAGAGTLTPNVKTCINCASNDAGVPEQLQWVPQVPLEEVTRYSAWVSTDLKDGTGRNAIASPTFALVRSRNPLVDANQVSTLPVISTAQALKLEVVRQRFKDCLDQVEAQGTPRSKIALGFCVTTQSTVSVLRALTAGINANVTLPTVATMWVDTTAALRPALAAASIPNAAVGAYIEGDIVLPFALTGTGGTLNPNPALWQGRKARFLLTVPPMVGNPGDPQPAYPVVIFGHGLGRSRRDDLILANTFASAGMASIAVDTVYHGDRSICTGAGAAAGAPGHDELACADPTTMHCETAGVLTGRCVGNVAGATCDATPFMGGDEFCYAAGSGRCIGTGPGGACEGGYFKTDAPSPIQHVAVSGNTFLNLANLFATRDNFRHAGAIDFAHLVKVIGATTPGVSINARLTAAGLPTLDATKIRYAGQSLGTFNGNTFAAANPTVDRFLLNVAGADQIDVLLHAPAFAAQRTGFLGALAAQGINPGTPGFDQFLTIASTIMDPSDPQNMIYAGVHSSNANRKLFIQYIEGDAVLPNSGTHKLLVAATQDATRQPSWFEFVQGATAAPGVFTDIAAGERHGFLLRPPPSNPACNPVSASCVTVTGQTQVAQFLAAGIVPTNTPVNP